MDKTGVEIIDFKNSKQKKKTEDNLELHVVSKFGIFRSYVHMLLIPTLFIILKSM